MDFINEFAPLRTNVNQSVSLNLFEDTIDDSNYIIKETTLASTDNLQTEQSDIPWSRSMETPNASMLNNLKKCENSSKLEATKLSPTIFKPKPQPNVSTSTPTINKMLKAPILPFKETPIVKYHKRSTDDIEKEEYLYNNKEYIQPELFNQQPISCALDNKFKECVSNNNPQPDELFTNDFFTIKSKETCVNIFDSFKTAGGSKIVVSQTTIEKVKKKFDHIEDSFQNINEYESIQESFNNESDKIVFKKASGGQITSTFVNPQAKGLISTKQPFRQQNSRKKFVPPFKKPSIIDKVEIKPEAVKAMVKVERFYGEIYKYVKSHKDEFKPPRFLEFIPDKNVNSFRTNSRYILINKLMNDSEFEDFTFNYTKEKAEMDKHKQYFINLNKDGLILFISSQFKAGKLEFEKTFYLMKGVDPKLIDSIWFYNQYRFIIYKLALLEYKFPSKFLNKYLTPYWVLSFLKYRYDVEINSAKRSVLKMITEKDMPPNNRMILRVSRISVPEFANHPFNVIELTDGWYPIIAEIDNEILKLIKNERIKLHDKLLICNATIKLGQSCAGSPLEMYGKIILGISINSSRKAIDSSVLGAAFPSSPFIIPLKSVKPVGVLSGVHVLISRFYGSEYCERLTDGRCIYRSEYEEDLESKHYQKLMMDESSDIYSNLVSNSKNTNDSTCIYKNSDNENCLRQQIMNETLKIVQDRHPKRNTSRVLKYKLTCLDSIEPLHHCLLFMWNVTEESLDLLKEGNCLFIYNLKCSSNRDFSSSISIKLSSTSYTAVTKSNTKLDLSSIYQPRQFISLEKLYHDGDYDQNQEIDVIGIYLNFSTNSNSSSEYYLVDCNEIIVRIIDTRKFNKNILKIKNGQIICFYNLIDKLHTKSGLRTLYYSTFSNYHIGSKNVASKPFETFVISNEFINRIKVKLGFS